MAAGKRACAEELPFIKLSDLMRLTHYQENSMGETTPMIQLSPPTHTLDTWGLSQFKVRFEWEHSQTISHTHSQSKYGILNSIYRNVDFFFLRVPFLLFSIYFIVAKYTYIIFTIFAIFKNFTLSSGIHVQNVQVCYIGIHVPWWFAAPRTKGRESIRTNT